MRLTRKLLFVSGLVLSGTLCVAQSAVSVCISGPDASEVAKSLSQQKLKQDRTITVVVLRRASQGALPRCEYLVQLWRYSPESVGVEGTAGYTTSIGNEPQASGVVPRAGNDTLSFELRKFGEKRVIAKGTTTYQQTNSTSHSRRLAINYDVLAKEIAAKIDN